MMKTKSFVGMLLLLAAMLSGCGSNSSGSKSTSTDFPLAADITEITRQWLQRADAPGAVVAVGMPDGRIWETAVGVAENDAPLKELDVAYGDDAVNSLDGTIPWHGRAMTPALFLRIGSRTKTYTAALMLKLREQGLVDFNAVVDHYLTPGLVPNGDKVTVQMLLDMTAGIEDYLGAFSPYDVTLPSTGEQIIRYVHGLPNGGIHSQPGETVYYSNTNYIIAGMIAEKVTGKTYKHLIENIVLGPLGLRSTAVPDPNSTSMPAPNAHGYKIELPWDEWSSLWQAQWATREGVMAYLTQNPGLVDAIAAQDTAAMGNYTRWVVLYLQSNPLVALSAYLQLHPDLVTALQAYRNGNTNALASYPTPLVQLLTSTSGLIDQILGRQRGRKAGIYWHDCTNMLTSAVGPVGGIVSTAADQVRWIRALELGNFLSPQSRALRNNAWHPYSLVTNATWDGSYGLGIYKKVNRATGNTFIGHGGRLAGYDSYGYLWQDHGWVVVVIVNALNLNLQELNAGYPSGSIAGSIGEAVFEKITQSSGD